MPIQSIDSKNDSVGETNGNVIGQTNFNVLKTIKTLQTRASPEKHPFKEKKPGFFSKLKGMFKEELEKELVKKLKRGK